MNHGRNLRRLRTLLALDGFDTAVRPACDFRIAVMRGPAQPGQGRRTAGDESSRGLFPDLERLAPQLPNQALNTIQLLIGEGILSQELHETGVIGADLIKS